VAAALPDHHNMRDKAFLALCATGDVARLDELLSPDELSVQATRARTPDGQTALHRAAAAGQRAMLVRLLDCGSALTVDEPDHAYHTPLMMAIAEGPHEDAVELLLRRGARVDTARPNGWNALLYAVQAAYPSVVVRLLEAGPGASLVDCRNKEGSSPVYIASRNGDVETLEVLVRFGANLGTLTNNRRSVLHAACRWGRLGVIRWLREQVGRCALSSWLRAGDSSGCTGLHLACSEGHDDCVDEIMRLGDPRAMLQDRDVLDRTCLHAACVTGHDRTVQCVLRHALSNASDFAAWATAMDVSGCTAAHLACANGHSAALAALIVAEVPLGVVNPRNGDTCLHLAVAWGRDECVRMLLAPSAERDAMLSTKNSAGRTPSQQADRLQESTVALLREMSEVCSM
jgi:ankyrin repeat protein